MTSDASSAVPATAGQNPCCGTAEQAAAADACCAPAAKADAIAEGAGCCGPAATVGAGERLPVIVIGAGPVGLAAAAHLHEQGVPFLVLEAGDQVGASVRQWSHVGLFSPWRYDIDPAGRRLLTAAGWAAPDEQELPTGADLVDTYLEPLAKLPAIAAHLRLGARVTAISRVGADRVRTVGRADLPFVVRLADGTEITGSAIIDASGTWRTPNPLGVNGLPAHGEPEAADLIDHALPDVLGTDRDAHAGKHTIVIGSGHSAANTLLDLARLAETEPGTRITWAVRGGSAQRAFGGEDADELPARGALGSGLHTLVDTGRLDLVTGFGVHTARTSGDTITLIATDGRELTADRVVSATGFRPDHSIAGELRLDLDPILGCTRTLAELIDPNQHSCGTVSPHGYRELGQPEPNYYAVGMKSYGRAPTFLMATGYEQVRSIAAALAGDYDAADDVQLDLPETGVCSVNLVAGQAGRLGPTGNAVRAEPGVTGLLSLTATGGSCCS
ncbi:FAD-dependent oxidoreductase [Actinoplanes sp. L3-i22]|uniref:FAD-dependent oxidoreductase n=1 Tax=Actinoplanes sp. L3-i22 TaxID=2836373 RepID=UPI001C75A0FC|nr:FAD-dependent oxidoreductase [Actinoplanes sp. L3-i22]BCY09312.1 flavoprotein [Actinoplanes sp. L3-i22]